MLKLFIQETYGKYCCIGMSGPLERREQFHAIIANNTNSMPKLIELGPNISYFLINSIEQFKKILAAARVGILSMANGYETSPQIELDGDITAHEIVEAAPVTKFLYTPEEIPLQTYKMHNTIEE